MAEYQYESKSSSGRTITGIAVAASLSAASEQIRGRGETIVHIAPAGTAAKIPWYKRSYSLGPSAADVQNFTNQLAVMLRAGISLRAAVEGIAEQTPNAKFKAMLEQVQRDVESGRQFSDAISRYPKVFGSLYINMVKASELSGGLSRMLDKISAYLLQQIETKRMVVGAMIYPGIIGTLAIGVTIFLLTWVLPQFMTIFKGHEEALPAPTKALLAASQFMTQYWYIVLAIVILFVWGLVFSNTTRRGRLFFDTLKLKVPLVKKLCRALYITRSLHTMGQLTNAGVPILDTITITADISGNVHYRRMWRSVHTAVKQGKKISLPLTASPLLPRSVVQMVSAGEESGKLGEVLEEVGEFYKRELAQTIKSVTSMIEPLMIVAMGGLVGFIAMSIILPIFQMSKIVD